MRNYFPLGIAEGVAFCNRKEEVKILEANLQSGKHTLLMATRRYGKSSLALQAIKLSKIPYVELDFYMAINEKAVESYLIKGVIEAIGKTLGPIEKFITSIKRYVKHLKPKLDIGTANIKLELSTDPETDPATNVKEALLLLERLLEENNKKAVLLLDEFQNVGVITQGKGIEGAIRHVAQKTKNLTFIFSGSNRKLLKTMFEDEARPLYKLCWKIFLTRISEKEYCKHIQKASLSVWQQKIEDRALKEILLLTERHPFYVNKLCDQLGVYYTKNPPTTKEIHETWQRILAEEKSDAIKEISLLSLNQKTVLLQIAKRSSHLTSKQSILELRMPSSSILAAIESLEEKDLIEKVGDHYQIINPIVRFYVLNVKKNS